MNKSEYHGILAGGGSEPTEQDIKAWYDWDQMQDHLAIRHPCPCCGKRRTRWIGREWSICYSCLIGFTFEDMVPVHTPEVVTEYQQRILEQDRANNESNRWDDIAYIFGKG